MLTQYILMGTYTSAGIEMPFSGVMSYIALLLLVVVRMKVVRHRIGDYVSYSALISQNVC